MTWLFSKTWYETTKESKTGAYQLFRKVGNIVKLSISYWHYLVIVNLVEKDLPWWRWWSLFCCIHRAGSVSARRDLWRNENFWAEIEGEIYFLCELLPDITAWFLPCKYFWCTVISWWECNCVPSWFDKVGRPMLELDICLWNNDQADVRRGNSFGLDRSELSCSMLREMLEKRRQLQPLPLLLILFQHSPQRVRLRHWWLTGLPRHRLRS